MRGTKLATAVILAISAAACGEADEYDPVVAAVDAATSEAELVTMSMAPAVYIDNLCSNDGAFSDNGRLKFKPGKDLGKSAFAAWGGDLIRIYRAENGYYVSRRLTKEVPACTTNEGFLRRARRPPMKETADGPRRGGAGKRKKGKRGKKRGGGFGIDCTFGRDWSCTVNFRFGPGS